MTQQDLLHKLEVELQASLDEIRDLVAKSSTDALRRRPRPDAWNTLEHFAHLNRYADDYIPEINRAIHRAKARCWMPNGSIRYTTRGKRLLRRGEPVSAKMFKTSKRYNFNQQPVEQEVVKSLLIKYEQLLRALQAAKEIDINRPMVEKAGAWFGRYTLGNILEFLVLHSRRHLKQVQAGMQIAKEPV